MSNNKMSVNKMSVVQMSVVQMCPVPWERARLLGQLEERRPSCTAGQPRCPFTRPKTRPSYVPDHKGQHGRSTGRAARIGLVQVETRLWGWSKQTYNDPFIRPEHPPPVNPMVDPPPHHHHHGLSSKGFITLMCYMYLSHAFVDFMDLPWEM